MKLKNYILIYILYIINCAPPPKHDLPIKAYVDPPVIMRYDNSTNNYKLLKNLEQTDSKQFVEKVNAIIYIEIDNVIQEQEIIISTKNMGESDYSAEYKFHLDVPSYKSFKLLSNSCYKLKANGDREDDCIPSFNKEGNTSYFNYNYHLYKDENIIINFKFQTLKDINKTIIYSEESISIYNIYRNAFCYFKVIISDRYTGLGFRYSYFTKENDNLYIYNRTCPYYSMNDEISLSLKESYWSAHYAIFYTCGKKFSGKAGFNFPRYYRGGKNELKYYKIMTLDGGLLNEDSYIKDENRLDVSLKFSKKKKIGAHLHAIFSNKLDRDFSVYFSEKFYGIDIVDNIIKQKALEIVGDTTSKYKDYPDYYKIGKYLYDEMTYDINYHGKDLTALQILYAMRGVCEHFTILYNAMLNAIGIKAMYVYGWAFQFDETMQDDTDAGHAWTAAFINNTWIELDATWGRFQGIPAGHILKGFGKEIYYYSIESSTYLFGSTIYYDSKKQITLIKDLDHFEEYYFSLGNYVKFELIIYILSLLNLLL